MAILLETPPITGGTSQRGSESSGVPVTHFAAKLVEQHLAPPRPRDPTPDDTEERWERAMKVIRECQALPRLDIRPADELLGYDSRGLPE